MSYEFIVVDNNSNDPGLPELAIKYPFVKFINAPENGGFSYGNNIGIKQSTGDIIFLLNPDTWLNDAAITKLLRRIESDDFLDIIGPQLFFPDGNNQSFYLPKTYLTLWRLSCEQFFLHRIFKTIKIFNSYFRTYMDYSVECQVEQVSGAALMMKKNVIQKIGYLDEDYFMYFEESDFCLKAVKAGMKLLYYPEAKIIHKGGLTSDSKSDVTTSFFYHSFKMYFKKNFGTVSTLLASSTLFIGTLTRFIIFKLIGNEKSFYYMNLLKSFFKLRDQK